MTILTSGNLPHKPATWLRTPSPCPVITTRANSSMGITSALLTRTLTTSVLVLCLSLTATAANAQQVAALPGENSVEPASTVSAENPERTFGYVLGDVLVQKIPLGSNPELIDELPLNRISTWLKRRSTSMAKDNNGNFLLSIDYQIINAPTVVIPAELPALELYFTDGSVVEVGAWSFTLGPITTELADSAGLLPKVQENTAPDIIDISVAYKWMRNALLALAATLLAWIGWWFWRQNNDKVRLPFAHARNRIGKLGGTKADNIPTAWIHMHDAINRSAGATVQLATLPALLEHKPWLAPLKNELEEFFKTSSERFFAQSHLDQKKTPADFPLYKLSRQLMLAEKRHAQ